MANGRETSKQRHTVQTQSNFEIYVHRISRDEKCVTSKGNFEINCKLSYLTD
jgi:hypothetical protein